MLCVSVGVDCQSGALEVLPATAAAFLSSSDLGSLFLSTGSAKPSVLKSGVYVCAVCTYKRDGMRNGHGINKRTLPCYLLSLSLSLRHITCIKYIHT